MQYDIEIQDGLGDDHNQPRQQNKANTAFFKALSHLLQRDEEEAKDEEPQFDGKEGSSASSYMTPRVGSALTKLIMGGEAANQLRTVGRNDSTVNYDNSLLS